MEVRNMKGKRKLLSLLLTFMLTVLMAVPASAEGVQYKPVTGAVNTAQFYKFLVMDRNANVPTVTFSFSIAAGTAVAASAADNTLAVFAGNDTQKVGGVPSVGTVSFSNTDTTYETVQNGDSVTLADNKKYARKPVAVDFSQVSFKEPGIYRYVITETANTLSGISNDPEEKRTLDVYVVDDPDHVGTLKIEGCRLYTGVIATAPVKDAATATGKSDGYTNTYGSYDLTIGKTVSGNQASRDEYFEFTVTLTGAHPSTSYTVDLSNADVNTKVNGMNSTATTNETTIVTDTDGKGERTFWLQTGQSITIKALTDSTKYVVSENAATLEEEGYTTKIDKVVGAATEEVTGTSITSKFGDTDLGIKGNTTLTFTNTKQGVIPTGIILSAAGLIVVAILVVAGVVFFGVRSRRKYEEE